MVELSLHLYHHFDAPSPQLDRIEAMLAKLVTMEATQMATMEELQAKTDEAIVEVSENNDAVASAVTVMETLSQQLADALANAADPTEAVAAVQQVIDGLNANTGALATAVAAHTPAAEG